MTADELTSILRQHREDIQGMLDEHKKYKGWDGTLYNGITVVVLLCTALLSGLSATKDETLLFCFTKGIAVLSMFLVALDRALGFGPRWRFHIEMEHAYRILLDDLLGLETIPPEDSEPPLKKFRTALAAVRAREHSLPGISSGSAGKKSTKP